MREILFRGKRIDNGEWAEGAFLQSDDGNLGLQPRFFQVVMYRNF